VRGTGQDGENVSVELVDVDERGQRVALAAAPGAGGEWGEEAPHGARRDPRERRRRWVLGGVGGAVVLGLVAASVVVTLQDARRAAERKEALAAVGVRLADLSDPLEEVWRTDGYVAAATGDLVVLDVAGVPRALRGVDSADGRVLWEVTQDDTEWCHVWNPAWAELVAATERGEVVDAADIPDPTVLVCGSSATGDTSEVGPEETGRVRVVDVATGVDAWVRQMAGRMIATDTAADVVVVTRAVPDAALVVTGLDAADGGERWEHVVPTPEDFDDPWVWAHVFAGVVHLRGPDGSVVAALDAATGEPTEPVDEAGMFLRDSTVRLDDGATVELAYTPGGPTGTVRGPGGEERFTFHGDIWTPFVVEPSAADPLLVVPPGPGNRLTALDPRTGEELWSTDMGATYLGGADGLRFGDLVVGGGPLLAAVHLLSGERVWQVETDDEAAVGLVTDGSRLLVPLDEDGDRWLAAIGLRDGLEAWRIPLDGPPWTGRVVGDGTVLLQRDNVVVAYR